MRVKLDVWSLCTMTMVISVRERERGEEGLGQKEMMISTVMMGRLMEPFYCCHGFLFPVRGWMVIMIYGEDA